MPEDNSPLISIITPTYNHERFIASCVESVLSQTYSNWEQIIIDDGSTDNTRSAVEEFEDRRIRYLRQENQGIEALAHTYNRALTASRGSLVAVLEGDDIWPLDKLATMVSAFVDPSVVLAYGVMGEIDFAGSIARRSGHTARKYHRLLRSVLFNDPVRSAIPYMLTVAGHSMIPASTVLIRRSALSAIGGFQYVPGQCYVDFPTFIVLALQGKFCYIPKTLGYRRMHCSSATAQFFGEMTDRSHQHLMELLAEPEYRLQEEELEEVLRSWRSVGGGVSFRRGRTTLLERNWREARRHFMTAMKLADLPIAMGAIVGWCLSWVHMDLEAIYRKAGRPALRPSHRTKSAACE